MPSETDCGRLSHGVILYVTGLSLLELKNLVLNPVGGVVARRRCHYCFFSAASEPTACLCVLLAYSFRFGCNRVTLLKTLFVLNKSLQSCFK